MNANGTTPPRVLTPKEREEVLRGTKYGPDKTEETKQLISGATLFKPGDIYAKNRANLTHRAQSNGFINHTVKAVVDGEDGYIVWWEKRAVPA